ncbi:hypothetical protein BDV24DRAFT_123305 [Aspergillus arachidicola]|uniref:Uncharacterized protein n=1 Tax=Aspergillus arachidicola TaxID=656916 RepID=A0A5N6YPC1_9EURO|nr:hypothetical protein BDV24DRAFT_123305 [Aspergillus arachidicola]
MECLRPIHIYTSGVEEPLACLPQAASSSHQPSITFFFLRFVSFSSLSTSLVYRRTCWHSCGFNLDVDGVIHSIHVFLSSLLQFLSPSTYLDDVEFNLIVPRENITIRVSPPLVLV